MFKGVVQKAVKSFGTLLPYFVAGVVVRTVGNKVDAVGDLLDKVPVFNPPCPPACWPPVCPLCPWVLALAVFAHNFSVPRRVVRLLAVYAGLISQGF